MKKSAYQQLIEKQEFKSRDELFNFLRTNKDMLRIAKKSEIKEADGIFNNVVNFEELKNACEKSIVIPKAQLISAGSGEMPSVFPLSVVINTTKLHDSHDDVHIDNLWKKCNKEPKLTYLLKQHTMTYEAIIADSVKDNLVVSIENMNWKDLGYKYVGETQALVFKCNVNSERNEYMAKQYWNGYVYNHSVGMMYMNYILCMNSESITDKEQKANWDKYYPVIANKEYTDSKGYFWAVLEAKYIEGSSVPLGSNFVTPTIQVGKNEPIEPEKSTQNNSLDLTEVLRGVVERKSSNN